MNDTRIVISRITRTLLFLLLLISSFIIIIISFYYNYYRGGDTYKTVDIFVLFYKNKKSRKARDES